MRQTILHVFNSSLISGPETLVMPALARSGWPVHILLLRESRVSDEKQKHVEEYLTQLKLSYTVISIHSRYDRQAIEKIKMYLENFSDLRVAHAHDVKASFYLLKATEKIVDRQFYIVSTHHGVYARSGFIVRLYELYYSHFLLPRFDRVLVVCTEDKKRLLQRGLSDQLVEVHLNGVTRAEISLPQRSAQQKNIRQLWGLPLAENSLILGVVARLDAEKRHSYIMQVIVALKKIKPDSLNVQVVCFGRGALEEKLRQQAVQLGLEKEMIWAGYRLGLGEQLSGFDVLLSLSQAEGLPINMIEAGWAGTPVFASAVDGVKDLVTDNKMGQLIPSSLKPELAAQKLLEFLVDKQELENKGYRFQQNVKQNFSQEKWLSRLQEIYQQLKINSKFNSQLKKHQQGADLRKVLS
jgi:glycosyltransferase involved in cell wall biosynthesis